LAKDIVHLKQATKRLVLPVGSQPRHLRFGLARGLRMQIDFARQTRTYLGLYEIELNRYLRRILRPGVTAFDVGGQHGYDALVIAGRTGARVASFECDPECVQGMSESFRLNAHIAGLIEPVEAMVGDGRDDLGLDEWAYNGGFVPDFIKIDIDGGELDALRSAERILRERHPPIIVETHSLDLERACGLLLHEHSYRPVVVNQRRVWPDRRLVEHNRWLVSV
jgi:Methyltransferase FkbM domain